MSDQQEVKRRLLTQSKVNENLSDGISDISPDISHRLTGTVDERVDKLFDNLGGCGWFQVFAYIAISFGMSSPSWFFY